jgi:hypothetical protein
MTFPMHDGGGRLGDVPMAASPSARVQLEVAILAADQLAPVPEPATSHAPAQQTVLVVAAEADLRRYVRECLRERPDVRVVEAATVAAAAIVATGDAPQLLIVDEPEREILAVLSRIRAILVVDDLPPHARPEARLRRLVRPFTAEKLLVEVGRLLD